MPNDRNGRLPAHRFLDSPDGRPYPVQIHPTTRFRPAARSFAGQAGEVLRLYPELAGCRLTHETIRRVIDTLVCDLIETTRINTVRRSVGGTAGSKHAPCAPVGSPTTSPDDRSHTIKAHRRPFAVDEVKRDAAAAAFKPVRLAYSAGQSLMYALSSLFSRLRSSSTALATSWKDTMPTTLSSSITGT